MGTMSAEKALQGSPDTETRMLLGEMGVIDLPFRQTNDIFARSKLKNIELVARPGSGAPKSRRMPSDCVGLEVAAAGGGGVGVWLALRLGLDLAEEAPALAFLGGATGAAGSS